MAVDAFMEMMGPNGTIKGESTDETFKDTIEIKHFELSCRSASDMADDEDEDEDEAKKKKKKKKKGKDDGKGSFTLKVKKESDAATPDLIQSYCENLGEAIKRLPKVRINLRKPQPKESQAAGKKRDLVYFILTLYDVYVVNYTMSLEGETSIPTETVEFAFTGCRMRYLPQEATGSGASVINADWDFLSEPPGPLKKSEE